MSANKIIFSSDLQFQNGIVYSTRNITDASLSPYQLTYNSGSYGGKDYMITITTNNSITINLPTDLINGCENGRQYYITNPIQDTANITISGGIHLINGTDIYTISEERTSLTLMFANITSEWYII
jgi:hypothetical protein